MAEPCRCIATLILLHGHVNGHENRFEHDRMWFKHIFQTVHNHTVSTDRQLTNMFIFKASYKTSLSYAQGEQHSLTIPFSLSCSVGLYIPTGLCSLIFKAKLFL
jgi:hypothetical protein